MARRIIDISVALKAGIASDPPHMLPQITYLDHKATAPLVTSLFPGLTTEQLPDGEGWAMRYSPRISYKADTPQYRSSTPVYPSMHFHSPTGNLSCYAWKSGSALSCSDLSTGANADLHSTQ